MSNFPFTLKKKDKDPNQNITHIFKENDLIFFYKAEWEKPLSGGLCYLAAPYSCIEKLFQEIHKGTVQKRLPCKETERFSSTDKNIYAGAEIDHDVIKLTWLQPTQFEFISRSHMQNILLLNK